MDSVLLALEQERLCGDLKRRKIDRQQKKRQTLPCSPARLWTCLRQPFALPPSTRGLHRCDWEIFGSGLAGCVLCGDIHVCGPMSCKELIESEDSEVCVITGMCIRGLHSNDEFVDTCIGVNNPHMASNDGNTPSFDIIHGYAQELLLSEQAVSCFRLQQTKLMQRLCRCVQDATAKGLPTLVDVVATAVQGVRDQADNKAFDRPRREQLSIVCAEEIESLINKVNSYVHLSFKHNDTRNTIFGLIFLLRHGVYVGGTCVVPRVSDLHRFLPNEGLLERCFNFRAKYITDVENKCKYGLRSASEGKSLRQVCRL